MIVKKFLRVKKKDKFPWSTVKECHVACVIYNELSKYSAVGFLFLFLVHSKFGKKSSTGRQIHRIFSVVFIFRNGRIANKVKY